MTYEQYKEGVKHVKKNPMTNTFTPLLKKLKKNPKYKNLFKR